MTILLKVILFLTIPIFILIGAFIFLMNWNWFLIPLGLPTINIFHAAGIMVIASYLKGYERHESKNDSLKQILELVLFNFFALALGFIFHFFI